MKTLKKCWKRGLEPFLFFGEPEARRTDNQPLTDSDRIFLKVNRLDIIKELNSYSTGTRIEGKEFYGNVYKDKFPT